MHPQIFSKLIIGLYRVICFIQNIIPGKGFNRQFQLLVYACRGRWEVRCHIADYAEKNKNGGRVNTE
jgi:hypothetical protein